MTHPVLNTAFEDFGFFALRPSWDSQSDHGVDILQSSLPWWGRQGIAKVITGQVFYSPFFLGGNFFLAGATNLVVDRKSIEVNESTSVPTKHTQL